MNRFLQLRLFVFIVFIIFCALTSQYVYARGFQSSLAYPAGAHPSGIASGDFDGDQHLDLIVVNNGNANSQSINFLHGNGDGTFQRPVITSSTGNLSAVVAGDFNQDGKLDIAITDSVQNTVSVLLGNGNGTFQTAVSYATAAQPVAIATGDLNRDGKLDLIVANEGSGNVSVFLANGDGTFQAAVNVSVGSLDPVAVAVGDLNGDGNLDVAVAINSNRYAVLKGNGDGTLQPGQAQILFNTTNPSGIAIGDVNGDGRLDLVVVTSLVQVLLGNGNLSFQSPVNYNADLRPSAVTLADLNGDHHLDIAVTNSFSNSVSILANGGDGTFSGPSTYGVGQLPVAVSAGDFNEDGKVDVAAADNGAGPTTGTVSIALGNGDGTLRAAAVYRVNRPGFGEYPGAYATADFNGDGRMDIAVWVSGGAVEMLLSSPDSSLQRGAAYSVGNAADVSVGDVNGDGKLDVVVTGYTNLTVLLGNGDATFQPQAPQPLPAAQTSGQNLNHRSALGDFNRDGKLDLVITNLTSTFSDVSVMLGNGDGTFQSPVNYFSGEGALAVVVADFNQDGKLDFAVANGGGGSASLPGSATVFLGRGDGTFTSAGSFTAGVTPYSLVAADFNNDGILDLALANSGNGSAGSVSVMMGTGTGSFSPATNYPLTVGLGTIVAADFTGDGFVDLAVSGSDDSVTLLVNNGNGTFQLGPKSYSGSGNLYVADLNGDAAPDLIAESTGFVLLLNTGGSFVNLASSFNPSGFQQNATFNMTITPSVHGVSPATGSVVFKDGAAVLGTAPVDSTGRSAFAISSLSMGAHTITAAYSGDTNLNPKTSLPLTQVVKLASSTSLNSSATLVVLGNSITFTASVSGTPGTPGGTVNFMDGETVLGSANLGTSNTAIFTASNLTGGNHSIVAAYMGDANFAGSKSPAISLGIQDYALAVSPGSANVRAGQSATFNITASPLAGLSGQVSFACSGLPALTTCAFNPTTATLSGSPVSTTLTVATTGTATALSSPPGNGIFYTFAAVLAPLGFAFVAITRRHPRPRRMAAIVLAISLLGFAVACGGGGDGNGGNSQRPSTPAGSNIISISATSTVNGTAITHQIPVSIMVTR